MVQGNGSKGVGSYLKIHECICITIFMRALVNHKLLDTCDLLSQYHEIILPVFRANIRARRISGPWEEEILDLSAVMNHLSSIFLLGILKMAQLTEKVICDPFDPAHLYYGESEVLSKGITCYFDDELEEANKAGDMIKVNEGNL